MYCNDPFGLEMECDLIEPDADNHEFSPDNDDEDGAVLVDPGKKEGEGPLLTNDIMLNGNKGPVKTETNESKRPAFLSKKTFDAYGDMEFVENRYDGIKIKNIGFWKPEKQITSTKRQLCADKTEYLPGVDSQLSCSGMSETDIVETYDKKRGPKKMKKTSEEVRNDWKNDKYNLGQYSKFIDALVNDRFLNPIYIYCNTDTKHKGEMCKMLKHMNDSETFVFKYYNENGDAVDKIDGQPLSKANNRLGKVVIIVIDTITKIIDGNFISMINSRIRTHDAGGAILVTGATSPEVMVYKFPVHRPINAVLIKNFEQASIQCEDSYVHIVKRIRKLEKSVEALKEKLK